MSVLEVQTLREGAGATPTEKTSAPRTRAVRHEYTPSLPAILSQLAVSLLVSTYQAGKVVTVGTPHPSLSPPMGEGDQLTLSYHNFERAMGLAVTPDGIAVGARAQIWFLKSAPD